MTASDVDDDALDHDDDGVQMANQIWIAHGNCPCQESRRERQGLLPVAELDVSLRGLKTAC